MKYSIRTIDKTVLPKKIHNYFFPLFTNCVNEFFEKQNIDFPEIQITYLNEFQKTRNAETWFSKVLLSNRPNVTFASIDMHNLNKIDLHIHLDSFIHSLNKTIKMQKNFDWFEKKFIKEVGKKEKLIRNSFLTALSHELFHYTHSKLNPQLMNHVQKRITLFGKFKDKLIARHMVEKFILEIMNEGIAEYFSRKQYFDSEDWKNQYHRIEKDVKKFKQKLYDSKNKFVLIEVFGKNLKNISFWLGIHITRILFLGKRDPRKMSRQEFFREYEKLCNQLNIFPLMTFKGRGILDYTDMKKKFKEMFKQN